MSNVNEFADQEAPTTPWRSTEPVSKRIVAPVDGEASPNRIVAVAPVGGEASRKRSEASPKRSEASTKPAPKSPAAGPTISVAPGPSSEPPCFDRVTRPVDVPSFATFRSPPSFVLPDPPAASPLPPPSAPLLPPVANAEPDPRPPTPVPAQPPPTSAKAAPDEGDDAFDAVLARLGLHAGRERWKRRVWLVLVLVAAEVGFTHRHSLRWSEARSAAASAVAAIGAAAGRTRPAPAAPPVSSPAPAPPAAAPAPAPAARPDIPAGMGLLSTADAEPGHRIFVDDRTVGQTPQSVLVKCGTVTVRIGSGAKSRTLDVPCGGEIRVGAP